MRVEATVERHEAATELLPLIVLGLGSIALTLVLAYTLLDGEVGFATSDNIELAGKLVILTLALSGVALAIALLRPRPSEAVAVAGPEGLTLSHGTKQHTFPTASIRHVLVLEEAQGWVVEVERRHSISRLHLRDGALAMRLGGALVGQEKLSPVASRVRRRAGYYLFVGACSLWILVYAALCVLPVAPILGLVLTGAILPIAVWVTLRAVPAQVVVSPAGVSILHVLGNRSFPLASLEAVEVVDDGCVLLRFQGGESLRIPELAEHPRSPSPAGLPPAECLAQAAAPLLRAERGQSA